MGIRYIFADLRSGNVIAEPSLQGVSMSNKLNSWGTFTGTLSLDQSGMRNTDIVNATLPGKCALTVERDNVPVWDGIVWTRTYQSQAKILQLSARTREAYLEKRFILEDLSYFDEQRNIFSDLLTRLQSTADGNLGLIIPTGFDMVVRRILDIRASEYKTYAQVISSFADSAAGFDWTFAITRTGNSYTRTVRVGYPFLGSTGAGVTFEYPGSITNYYKSESMTNAATHLYVIGAGEGSSMLVGTSALTDMSDYDWLRYDDSLSRKDMDFGVNTYTAQMASILRPPVTTFKVFVVGRNAYEFGSYALGDTAVLAIKDARHPSGLQTTARIVAWEYRPQSDDTVEQTELIFEGDELNDG